jgi:hypothetical protein
MRFCTRAELARRCRVTHATFPTVGCAHRPTRHGLHNYTALRLASRPLDVLLRGQQFHTKPSSAYPCQMILNFPTGLIHPSYRPFSTITRLDRGIRQSPMTSQTGRAPTSNSMKNPPLAKHQNPMTGGLERWVPQDSESLNSKHSSASKSCHRSSRLASNLTRHFDWVPLPKGSRLQKI